MFSCRICRSTNLAIILALLSAIGLSLSARAADPPRARKIAVFGSSVASGAVDHEGRGGYAGRLGELMAPRGWQVVNVSKGGDNTRSIAPRFEADLVPQQAGYVIIGLSLSNEGLAKQPDAAYRDGIFEQWKTGVRTLIDRCRAAGMVPVVASCYPRTEWAGDPALYAYTRRMNVEISRWDVPSVNFLGAIDDGQCAWVANFQADGGHPNGSGHQEMMLAIVPSLFEALEAGKPIPAKAAGTRYAHLQGGGAAPLTFTPADPMHSFAMSLWIRGATDGVVASITGKVAKLREAQWQRDGQAQRVDLVEAGQQAFTAALKQRDGQLVYAATDGAEIASPLAKDGAWHLVVLSHACAMGASQLYVDGARIGDVHERLVPEAFGLGGAPCAAVDVKEWTIWRSSLTEDEVRFVNEGHVYQSSLEIYAPLEDEAFAAGATIENRAQSTSAVKVIGEGLASAEQ